MDKYVNNIEKITLENEFFRKVLVTTEFQQLVVMSLKPSEDIGMELHNLDQFIKVEEGSGIVSLNGEEIPFGPGFSINIPKGTNHNITNSSNSEFLKLYTIYSPPNHKDGTIHQTKQEAISDENDIPEKNTFNKEELSF